jgi:hypothetical protein
MRVMTDYMCDRNVGHQLCLRMKLDECTNKREISMLRSTFQSRSLPEAIYVECIFSEIANRMCSWTAPVHKGWEEALSVGSAARNGNYSLTYFNFDRNFITYMQYFNNRDIFSAFWVLWTYCLYYNKKWILEWKFAPKFKIYFYVYISLKRKLGQKT